MAGEERRRARTGHAEAELRLRWLRLECEQVARRRVDVHSILLAQCHRFVVRLEVTRIYKYEIYELKKSRSNTNAKGSYMNYMIRKF